MSSAYALLSIGAGPAGLGAARAYREREPGGRVALVTDEHLLPYHRPPLTKGLLQGTSDVRDLPIEPEGWFDAHRVELIGGRAVALDTSARTVTLSGGRTLEYGTCLLATGAEPKRLAVPGADHPRVSVMRTLDDLRRLEQCLGGDASIAVIGSGFIGCEIAASLTMRGHVVSLVSDETSPNRARLGADASDAIAGWLAQLGVTLALGVAVEGIERRDGELHVIAGSHDLRAPVIVMATGVTPRGELLGAAGASLHNGAIPVDAAMRTTTDGVLAAGDVTDAENAAAGRRLRVEHWGDALGQGAVAGRTAAGSAGSWSEVPGFWSTIGRHTLKYAAWGDGYDTASVQRTGDGDGFTVWYAQAGRVVGVLAHNADEDYDRGRELIADGAPWPQ